ncbi:uncharacterized protein A4U43_C09F13710 [Asparagus officinalis]|uniref:Uncharacterized protein n=1 Tax=Asparagus officinalis TaxID=4686 RepID=A0A5P1E763_ASPOF|nr:uncharacterized protein A4U43_C09F13710 [Asparagus officinalis]
MLKTERGLSKPWRVDRADLRVRRWRRRRWMMARWQGVEELGSGLFDEEGDECVEKKGSRCLRRGGLGWSIEVEGALAVGLACAEEEVGPGARRGDGVGYRVVEEDRQRRGAGGSRGLSGWPQREQAWTSGRGGGGEVSDDGKRG